MKATAQKGSFDIDFSAAVKSSDVKFNLDDQPLFIVRFDATNSSAWVESYDLAGNEMSSLCIRKQGSGKLEVASVDESTDAKTEVKLADESPERPFIFSHGYEVEWFVNEIMEGGQRAVEEVLEFADRLFWEGVCNRKATGDLDLLRRELFRHSGTFDSTLRLYERRHYFPIGLGSPDEMIEQIITDKCSGFAGDNQQGGDE